jgi:two-component system, NarL family, nitrate/nitrite response regulator NarL
VKTSSIYACESQPIVLEGLENVLKRSGQFVIVGSSSSQSAGMAEIVSMKPELVLTDHASGLKSTFQFASEIRLFSPRSQVILWVTEMSEIDCFRALQMGVRGILKKTMPISVLLDCLESVADGQMWLEHSIAGGASGLKSRHNVPRLTPREIDIVNLICKGMKNKEIANMLAITAGTVKVHLMHIFEKTGVKDRFELAVQAKKLFDPTALPPVLADPEVVLQSSR